MKVLVADTSSSMCNVGIFEDENLIIKKELDNGKTHSENFMRLIDECLKESNINLDEIECIAVVAGPGSFTGIRIGVASCKAMAEVKKIKLVSMTSLEVLAANEYNGSETICSLIDARNNQVYSGIFDEDINLKEEYLADDINIVLEKLEKYDEIKFVGDASELYKDLILEKLSDKKISFSCENKQRVEGLGIIANKKIEKGEFIDSDSLIPIYLRKSQAERMKALGKNN